MKMWCFLFTYRTNS